MVGYKSTSFGQVKNFQAFMCGDETFVKLGSMGGCPTLRIRYWRWYRFHDSTIVKIKDERTRKHIQNT